MLRGRRARGAEGGGELGVGGRIKMVEADAGRLSRACGCGCGWCAVRKETSARRGGRGGEILCKLEIVCLRHFTQNKTEWSRQWMTLQMLRQRSRSFYQAFVLLVLFLEIYRDGVVAGVGQL